jgi:hypothetical protein
MSAAVDRWAGRTLPTLEAHFAEPGKVAKDLPVTGP